ncbi:MAG: hypothetical protein AAGF95_33480 [Chloroflexota bacterium]
MMRHIRMYAGGFILILLLTQCAGITPISYTIPGAHEGFLVIYYECPDGAVSRHTDGRVHVTFNADGVACIEESYTQIFPGGMFRVTQITTPSGQEVPFAGNNLQHRAGYALVDLSLKRITHGGSPNSPTNMYGILWAGDLTQLQQLMDEREYTNAMADFFEERMGVPRNLAHPPRLEEPSPEIT